LGVLGVAFAVVLGGATVLPVVVWLPPWSGAVLLAIWSGLMTALLCTGISHITDRTRWIAPVLRAFDEAEVARRVDRELDAWGDITLESNRALSAIRSLALRIDDLAGDRIWIRDSVHSARAAARTLAEERRALSRIAAKNDLFDGARARIDAQLETLAQRLLALFEAMVAQTSECGLDAVADALSRVSAEAEVANPGRPRMRCLSG